MHSRQGDRGLHARTVSRDESDIRVMANFLRNHRVFSAISFYLRVEQRRKDAIAVVGRMRHLLDHVCGSLFRAT